MSTTLPPLPTPPATITKVEEFYQHDLVLRNAQSARDAILRQDQIDATLKQAAAIDKQAAEINANTAMIKATSEANIAAYDATARLDRTYKASPDRAQQFLYLMASAIQAGHDALAADAIANAAMTLYVKRYPVTVTIPK